MVHVKIITAYDKLLFETELKGILEEIQVKANKIQKFPQLTTAFNVCPMPKGPLYTYVLFWQWIDIPGGRSGIVTPFKGRG